MLNNRQHAEHLALYVDQLRESRTPIPSREKGYWLDLLAYRDDKTGRCDPGRRELKTKTSCGHATLTKMDARAEELGLYTVERFHDGQGRLRLRFTWNLTVLEFDNDGQATRVTTRRDRAQPSTTRAQVSTEIPQFLQEQEQEEQNQGYLRAQVSTADTETRPPRSRRFSDLQGHDESPGGRSEQWDLLERIAEIGRQEQECKPEEVVRRYELDKQKRELEAELATLRPRVTGRT